VLVYPAVIDLSSKTLTFVTGHLVAHRGAVGSRWRKLPPARQALLVLAHLRCGDSYATLAAGFGVGVATVSRYVAEVVGLLAAVRSSDAVPVQLAAVPGDAVRHLARCGGVPPAGGRLAGAQRHTRVLAAELRADRP
jgi:hypothetical protein